VANPVGMARDPLCSPTCSPADAVQAGLDFEQAQKDPSYLEINSSPQVRGTQSFGLPVCLNLIP